MFGYVGNGESGGFGKILGLNFLYVVFCEILVNLLFFLLFVFVDVFV